MKTDKKTYTISRNRLQDSRGWFLKVADGNEPGNPFPCEVYFTAAVPGESRGGHYHQVASEWFTLIVGEALLTLQDVSSGEKSSIKLRGANPQTIFVPAGIAHTFFNCGSEDFMLMAYTDRKYQPEDTIPFSF